MLDEIDAALDNTNISKVRSVYSGKKKNVDMEKRLVVYSFGRHWAWQTVDR